MSEAILIVDDDGVFRRRLGRAMAARGLAPRLAASYDEALALLAEAPVPKAIVDLRMPGRSGLELVEAIAARWPATEVVVLTGYGSIATAVAAVRLGALNYLTKPADADDVLAAFEKAEAPPLAPTDEYQAPSLARAEWEHINRVLADCGGNISEAARRLGLHRRSLQRKLQKYPPAD
ncbi:MAG: response regulator [Myxococcales bacterium]|nr:response regulator [Myxococcales bacterium]